MAEQIIATVRDWVRKEVIPVASDYEHADEFPAPLVEQMKAFGLFGAKVPDEYGGLGLDTVTYTRLMEELAYGWMSLAGVLNTHTIVVTLLEPQRHREQKQEHLPADGHGRDPGRVLAVRARRRVRRGGLRCKADARRRRVRHQRHEDVGHQRRAGRARGPRRPHARGHHLLHLREGARRRSPTRSR